MIDAIEIQRFKCFENLSLKLAPLTLLTGYNGGGKSTSLQPLLLISQAMREGGAGTGLSLNGSLARLGTVGDVISSRGAGSMILGFRAGVESASWKLRYDRVLGSRELLLEGTQFSAESDVSPRWLPTSGQSSIVNSIRDLIYLSGVRPPIQEAQPYPDTFSAVVGDVGSEGQYAAYWYVKQSDEEVDEARRHPTEERTTVRGQIDAWLGDLFPGARANAEALKGVALSKLSFKLGKSSGWRRPANVGYGLSYVLPLLVALVSARNDQLIVVDSPEAHLHPSAQSNMGRVLAHFAAAGLQILVESHSDHLLSGVRLAVKNGRLRPEHAIVHFFERADTEGSNGRHEIHIERDGTVTSWPEGFFDQSLADLARLS